MAHSKGFSLIETLVVLGIIVLITAIAMPTVSSYFKVSLNSAARDLANNIKEAYNAAVLTGRVYRVAYDLKENTFWVESGPGSSLLDTKQSREKEERRKKLSHRKESSGSSSGAFMMDKTITRKATELPRGVTFEDIFNQQGKEPIQSGIAYTHFFPTGLSEQTVIHLKDQSKHQATLVITPLLGKTDLYDHYVKREEVFAEKP